MNINQLQPASSLAQQFGVKALVYGGPGTGKTPIAKTAPRPVLLVTEPGMLSMKDATNIPAWQAYDSKPRIDEFFTWLFQSKESKNFDTVCIDSASQIAEIFLKGLLTGTSNSGKKIHGLAAYGEMARQVYELLEGLFYMKEKHMYLICKQSMTEIGGVPTTQPYFPGQDLNIRVPHLYDEIFHVERIVPPGYANEVAAFRTKETFGIKARDRSCKLNEFEPANLAHVFKKCMSN